jgi:hypothetical protein
VERATLRTLREVPTDTPGYTALRAYALFTARQLDEGAGLAVAAVGREYRMTIELLTKGGSDDEHADARELYARLSAPLGHTAN